MNKPTVGSPLLLPIERDEASDKQSVPNWNLDAIVEELRAVRMAWRKQQGRQRELGLRELPSGEVLQSVIKNICGALFPMRLGPQDLRNESEDFYVGHTLDSAFSLLLQQVLLELRYSTGWLDEPATDTALRSSAINIVRQFAAALPNIRRMLDKDVVAAYQGDPAARSVDEVLLCYPGIVAIMYYRLAHKLYALGVPLLARIVAEQAHSSTGIDIHPGARIGESFFIDHGTGVVIGETTIIGNRVRIYQAVTLGAKKFPEDGQGGLQKGRPRHPVVEDDVVIYAGATILGRVTIGRGAVIGGNVWITRDIPPNSSITQSGRRDGEGV